MDMCQIKTHKYGAVIFDSLFYGPDIHTLRFTNVEKVTPLCLIYLFTGHSPRIGGIHLLKARRMNRKSSKLHTMH